MALDRAYFDAIELDVVKKKYYNAKKVDAVLADIRHEAEELTAENERMRSALSALADRRVELGDAMLSGQGIYRGIVEKANARAAEIVSDAEKRAAAVTEEAQKQREASVQRTERLFNTMKQQHLAAIEALNGEWQQYLCSLYPEDTPEEDTAPGESAPDEAVPDDLSDKVDAIARQLFAIEAEE